MTNRDDCLRKLVFAASYNRAKNLQVAIPWLVIHSDLLPKRLSNVETRAVLIMLGDIAELQLIYLLVAIRPQYYSLLCTSLPTESKALHFVRAKRHIFPSLLLIFTSEQHILKPSQGIFEVIKILEIRTSTKFGFKFRVNFSISNYR